MNYYIKGGVYTDTTFRELVEGTEEQYGPFSSHSEAMEFWGGVARAKIDNCCHRLQITCE